MTPLRLAFCMSHPGYARNFESTLRELDRRGHQVTALVERMPADGGLVAALARELPGLRAQPAPAAMPDGWQEAGCHLRAAVDYLRFLEPPYDAAVKPRARAAARVPRAVARLAGLPAARRPMRRVLRAADRAIPVDRGLRAAVAALRPDALLVTPLVDLGSPQQAWVRAARAEGVPAALCVASWDNLTMRGGIPEPPDLVCVWNEAQAREARELHAIPAERVVVSGAVAYDHWFGWRPRSRPVVLTPLGLDPRRPYLLYVGSSPFIAADEPAFILDWARRVRAALGPDAQILVRPHPLAPIRAAQRAALEALDGLAVHPPAGANPTDAASRADYFDAIHHAAALVGVNTSAFVESAIVGTPPHTMLDRRHRDTQEGTLHFGHLLPGAGGPLTVARDWGEHIGQLSAALAGETGDVRARLDAFVRAFIRPHGTDVAAAPVLADAIERLAGARETPGPVAARPGGAAVAAAARLAVRMHAGSRAA